MIKRKSFPRILKRAKAKLTRFSATQMVGCLTPVEIVVLCEHMGYESEIMYWYEHRVKVGICNPSWFYFPVSYLDLSTL